MTTEDHTKSPGDQAQAAYVMTPGAVRERANELYSLALAGRLAHFDVEEERLDSIADRVVRITTAAYPDVHAIPYHSRWRHFRAGGVDRDASFERAIAAQSPIERLCARFDLVVTSVLLDAGAGPNWRYRDAGGSVYARSEGLAVASYDLFVSGGFARDATRSPLRADAEVLANLETDRLASGFQVARDNPLVGLDGRVALLRRLGATALAKPRYFGSESARVGRLAEYLVEHADEGTLSASFVLATVLDAFGSIWPGRETLAGVNLGDAWKHSKLGLLPFHKLSQWLTYSLCETLERHGLRITELDALTGLAEYRNGGLFVDGSVAVPKTKEILERAHEVGSDVVIEWRALTVALLDRTAVKVRERLGLSPEELPLAKVLEGGTWQAGREVARELRADGSPPIRVLSDGTVF